MAATLSKIDALETQLLRSDIPEVRVGDTVNVHYKIKEGDKLRVQVFKGTIIKRHRAGARSTITVRKTSFNIGVERIFLLHTPRLEKIELVSRGVVRRGRLMYLRNLKGKAARIRDEKDR
jgi:large subunit ribosomal protein L19